MMILSLAMFSCEFLHFLFVDGRVTPYNCGVITFAEAGYCNPDRLTEGSKTWLWLEGEPLPFPNQTEGFILPPDDTYFSRSTDHEMTSASGYPEHWSIQGTLQGTQGVDRMWETLTYTLESCDTCPPLMKASLGGSCHHSPLVIDVAGNGFRFSDQEGSVLFDILSEGRQRRIQWTIGDDDAFLVVDWNENGRIDDGSELFGEGAWLNGLRADNGFVALGFYDAIENGGNEDGFIDSRDSIWPRLQLWTDRNSDGQSNPSELSPVDGSLIYLETTPRESIGRFDQHGNKIPYWSHVRTNDGIREMVDVYFKEVN